MARTGRDLIHLPALFTQHQSLSPWDALVWMMQLVHDRTTTFGILVESIPWGNRHLCKDSQIPSTASTGSPEAAMGVTDSVNGAPASLKGVGCIYNGVS